MLNIHVAATTKVMQSCLLVTHGRRHLPRLTFRQRPGWWRWPAFRAKVVARHGRVKDPRGPGRRATETYVGGRSFEYTPESGEQKKYPTCF